MSKIWSKNLSDKEKSLNKKKSAPLSWGWPGEPHLAEPGGRFQFSVLVKTTVLPKRGQR